MVYYIKYLLTSVTRPAGVGGRGGMAIPAAPSSVTAQPGTRRDTFPGGEGRTSPPQRLASPLGKLAAAAPRKAAD